MATPNVPSVLWLGRVENEWPIQAWETEEQAKRWLADGETRPSSNRRHIWQVAIKEPVEFKIVYTEPRLEPVREHPLMAGEIARAGE